MEGLKEYENLESYNQFSPGWVKKVKIKLFLNYLLRLPWFLYGSVRNVFLHSTVRYKLGLVFIASAKIPAEREESISSSSFYGQLPNY